MPEAPLQLTLRIVPGESRFYAECPEFGLSVAAPTERIARCSLEDLIPSYCRTLAIRNGTSGVAENTVKLAETVVARGFSLNP